MSTTHDSDSPYHDHLHDGDSDLVSVNSRSLSLENPYDMHHRDRDDVSDKIKIALKKWKTKVKWWSTFLILSSSVMIYSNLWYANVVGVAAGALGIYGACKDNSEFLFVYLALLFLELLKNIGVFFYFVSGSGNDEPVIVGLNVGVVIIEEFVVVPANIFYAFKLYRTLKILIDNDLDETLTNY
eukprot:316273_1